MSLMFRQRFLFGLVGLALSHCLIAAEPSLVIPFARDLKPAAGSAQVTVSGPHRFIKIGGVAGYQPLSLETQLRIATDLHCGSTGSIALWVAPLETLNAISGMKSFMDADPSAKLYNLLSDSWPARSAENSVFAWRWTSNWNPTMSARFHSRSLSWDHVPVPWAFVEHLPLEEKNWYQLVLTWNKQEHRIRMFVNGLLAGSNYQPFEMERPRPELFLGNTAMTFSGLELYSGELTPDEVSRKYRAAARPANPEVQRHLEALFTPVPKPAYAWKPDGDWKLGYSASFTKPDDLQGWIQQGCLQDPFKMRELRTTADGLLLDTPAQIENETRVYLWSPRNFEGDVAVEFEFRPERDSGLALLVVQASGMQREDMIADQPKRTTGSMKTIIADRVRNYHWEFFRSYDFNLRHVSTQVMAKNPWERPLGFSSQPRLRLGEFHKAQFVQEGRHLRAAVDGKLVLDVVDDPAINLGPVFNFGRIGLRLMYDTRVTFRNLKVWNRNTGIEIVE
jgi:hypothetical protein